MPKTEHHDIDLPPAKLSKQQIQEINDALPQYFEGNLTWTVWAGKTRIDEYTLDDLLKSIERERGITELSLSVEVEDPIDVTLDLSCWEKESFLAYSCPRNKSGEMQQLARVITGVFHENKRRGWWIPWIHASTIELGEQAKPRFLISWKRITENTITNVLSYVIISGITFAIGFFIGRIS